MTKIRAVRAAAALLVPFLVSWAGPVLADPLITDEEAQRPNDAQTSSTRAITRGPTIRFETPKQAPAPHAPFEFKLLFEAHGGATVDPASVHVVYLKSPAVDLTPRLKPFITPQGIDMTGAEVPAGEHVLKVDVQDSEGREGEAVFTLDVPR